MEYILNEFEHTVIIEAEALDYREKFSGVVAAERIVRGLAALGLGVNRITIPATQVSVTYTADGIKSSEPKEAKS